MGLRERTMIAAESIIKMCMSIFTDTKFMGNELWRWLLLFGVLLGSLVVGKIVSFFLAHHARKLKATDEKNLVATLLSSMAGPIAMLAMAAGLYIAGTFLKFKFIGIETLEGQDVPVSKDFSGHWLNICKTLSVLAAGWFIFKLVDVIEVLLQRWTSRTETALDDQLVPLVRKTLRLFVVIVVGLFIAQNIFDWNIGSLIAGLGIGGLAMALAAKDTLSNLFGSVTIFSDRPFQLGDRIKIAGYDGTVEEVGFRSTRLRTLMGHQVIVPNSMIANEVVENVGRRPYLRRVLNVGVTYDTSPDKLQKGVEIIRELLDARMDNFPEDSPPQVYFSDFNDCSLNIVVYYWYSPPEWWDYLKFNHDFNMELLQRFNAEGIEFAFPTQTVYVKKDDPPAPFAGA